MVTVIYWYATERAGAGNIIPYGAYQAWAIADHRAACCWPIPARRYSHGGLLGWAAGWYGLAKVFETFDLQIYRLLGGTLSGHTIKHVLAVVRGVRHRAPAARLPALELPAPA